MYKIGYVIRDFIVFFIFLMFVKYLLGDFRIDVNIYRSKAEYIAIGFMFISAIGYAFFINKRKPMALLYGIIIFVLFLYLSDRRIFPDNGIFMIGMGLISFLYYQLDTYQRENFVPQNLSEIPFNNFTKLGETQAKVDSNLFELKKEMDLEKGTFQKFRPQLMRKNLSEKNDLFLAYSNQEDLHFTVVISNEGEIYVDHKKNKKYKEVVNKSIYASIERKLQNRD